VESGSDVYDRWHVWPFVGAVIWIVSAAWVVRVEGWGAVVAVGLTLFFLARLALDAPLHVVVDDKYVRVRYAARTASVSREDAVIIRLDGSWWRPDQRGWFIIDRRASWHRYPLAGTRFTAPVKALQQSGYTIRVGDPADWGPSPSAFS
jgi:hypothetical protein